MNVMDEILASITPKEMAQTVRRMTLASLNADAIEAKGWSHREFAAKIGKKSSDIPIFLRGHYDFTVDELTQIEFALDSKLFFSTALDWTPNLTQKSQYPEIFESLSIAAEPESGFYS
jgi:ribosome-binding protein aMBF1 (putative translation factor)